MESGRAPLLRRSPEGQGSTWRSWGGEGGPQRARRGVLRGEVQVCRDEEPRLARPLRGAPGAEWVGPRQETAQGRGGGWKPKGQRRRGGGAARRHLGHSPASSPAVLLSSNSRNFSFRHVGGRGKRKCEATALGSGELRGAHGGAGGQSGTQGALQIVRLRAGAGSAGEPLSCVPQAPVLFSGTAETKQ